MPLTVLFKKGEANKGKTATKTIEKQQNKWKLNEDKK